MKLIIIILAVLVVLFLFFIMDFKRLYTEQLGKYVSMECPPLYTPTHSLDPFIDSITTKIQPKYAVEPTMESITGGKELLKMDRFIDMFYTPKDITMAKSYFNAYSMGDKFTHCNDVLENKFTFNL